jgi:anthranilate phosphoribosyltransferase
VAEALALLGALRAMVVHADAGMDEISPLGSTTVWEVHGGTVREWRLDPAELGWEVSRLDGLAGGTPEENAARIEDLFGGGGTVEERNAILLNAAAAIAVSDEEGDLASAARRARASLEQGKAARVLGDLRRAAPRAG